MKLRRKSYVPDMKNKDNIMWMVMTIVSFMIILVLLVLLMFGYLDSFNNVINKASFEQSINKMKTEYVTNSNNLKTLNDELTTTKQNIESIKATDGKKVEFYQGLNKISDLKFKFAQHLSTALDTKGILKSNSDKIFIAKTGNIVLLNSVLFKDSTSSVLNADSKVMLELLANKMQALLGDKEYSKYVKFIVIESHLDVATLDEANKTLANQRAMNLLNELLSSNEDLKMNYSKKFITTNSLANVPLVEKQTDIRQNERIEISLIIDDAAILEELEKFLR